MVKLVHFCIIITIHPQASMPPPTLTPSISYYPIYKGCTTLKCFAYWQCHNYTPGWHQNVLNLYGIMQQV